jgi:hypothetical protein
LSKFIWRVNCEKVNGDDIDTPNPYSTVNWLHDLFDKLIILHLLPKKLPPTFHDNIFAGWYQPGLLEGWALLGT